MEHLVELSLAVVGTALAIWALWYARRQFTDAQDTLRSTKENLTATQQISEKVQETLKSVGYAIEKLDTAVASLPTRHVGRFPGSIPAIVDLLKSAKNQVVIVTDFAAYGSYSSYDAFRKYRDALNALDARDVRVTMIFCAGSERRSIMNRDFTAQWWEETAKRSDPHLAEFQARMRKMSVPVATYKEFIEALVLDEDQTIRAFNLQPNIMCKEMGCCPDACLWMVDDMECVFSFEKESDKQTHFTFRSRDPALINYFKGYFSGHDRNSKPLDLQTMYAAQSFGTGATAPTTSLGSEMG